MKRSRLAPRWAKAWSLIGIIVCGVLLYYAIAYMWTSSGREDETIRRRFQLAEREKSTGHSPFSLPPSSRTTSVDQQLENLDPSHAGWDSEVVSAAISKQLSRLSRRLESQNQFAEADFPEIFAEQFDGEILSPKDLQTVFDDGRCRVRRLVVENGALIPTESGSDQVYSLLGIDDVPGVLRCSFKVTQIQLGAQQATSRLLFQSLRQTDATVEQRNAVLRSEWKLDDRDAPQLRSLAILDYETIQSAGPDLLFDDVTGAVLMEEDNREVNQVQLHRGIGYWCERLSAIDDMSIYGHHGLAVADVNRDGLEDIYICDSGGLPNRLFLQRPDGTLKDVSRRSNADWLESTSSALLIDLDNDGDPDLVAATVAGVIVASNDGTGIFEIRSALPGMPEAQSLCAADYDNDGDLDLYITIYGPSGSVGGRRGFEASAPIPYYDANNGGANRMLENRGQFQMVDVTERCGLDKNNRRFSFAAAWEDFDVDGDMDLYVANDFGRNNLYQNEGGVFRDVAPQRNVEDMAGGMSVCWGDVNQDGAMDIYIGNMYSAAGNRVTYQHRFLESQTQYGSSGIQRMARGNTLFLARPDGVFDDVSQTADVTMGRWAWSSKFADLNNDGREDLVVANGYISNVKPDDL